MSQYKSNRNSMILTVVNKDKIDGTALAYTYQKCKKDES